MLAAHRHKVQHRLHRQDREQGAESEIEFLANVHECCFLPTAPAILRRRRACLTPNGADWECCRAAPGDLNQHTRAERTQLLLGDSGVNGARAMPASLAPVKL